MKAEKTKLTKLQNLDLNKPKRNKTNQFARECISTALMQLLKERHISEITISDICTRAGVSRMSYYRNYSSKEDILVGYLDDVLEKYYHEFKKFDNKGNYYDYKNLLHCFNYFEIHLEFLNRLFENGLGSVFLERLGMYMTTIWYDGKSIEKYYAVIAFAGAIYSVFIKWSAEDEKHKPETMARILSELHK